MVLIDVNTKYLILCSLLRLRLAVNESIDGFLSSYEVDMIPQVPVFKEMDETIARVYDFVKLNF